MSRPVVLHVAAVEFTASRLLRPQMAHLRDAGYDVRLACAAEGASFADDLKDFDPIQLAFPRSLDAKAMATAAVHLRSIVKRLRPDLVHFHSPAASIPGRPVLVPMGRRPKLVYTVHGFLHAVDSRSRRDRTLDRVERLLSRWTDALLFQSAEDFDHARATGFRGRLVYLGNGVADECFVDRPAVRADGPLRVVYVGRLTREKGVLELLGAADRVPEVEWTIVGAALPSDRDPVEAAVDAAVAASAGRIRRVGMVPPDAVREHLARADLLVLPSWREGVPRSVIEAMAAGLPVVATDIRGCRELVTPGVNGWIVPVRDPAALAAAVRAAAQLAPAALAELGEAGRERAWERHREKVVFSRIADLYRDLGVSP